jgi:hypothetical protein
MAAHSNAHKVLLRKSGDVLFEGHDRDVDHNWIKMAYGIFMIFPDLTLEVADI